MIYNIIWLVVGIIFAFGCLFWLYYLIYGIFSEIKYWLKKNNKKNLHDKK